MVSPKVSYCIFTFSLKGGTLWLLFDKSELPASLHLHFRAIVRSKKGSLNASTVIQGSHSADPEGCWAVRGTWGSVGTPDREMIHVPNRVEEDGVRFQNSAPFYIREFFGFGIFPHCFQSKADSETTVREDCCTHLWVMLLLAIKLSGPSPSTLPSSRIVIIMCKWAPFSTNFWGKVL